MLAIERGSRSSDGPLAVLLRRRFDKAHVVEADACTVRTILAGCGVTRLAAVVSSLPIKWFPIAGQRSVIWPCLDLAGEGGSFLQLTNAMVSPVAMTALGLSGSEIARVWSQFPPVQIWRYRRANRARPT
jgi:phosphatidylethanolamine/phosphatidyl-N-methylethanolamine N-methyltransferase